jgi:hypothetical protein
MFSAPHVSAVTSHHQEANQHDEGNTSHDLSLKHRFKIILIGADYLVSIFTSSISPFNETAISN